MKTREPPLSSKGESRDKAEGSAPKGETPMARFRKAAANVLSVPASSVKEVERKDRKKKKS